jgi:hypothetical protein
LAAWDPNSRKLWSRFVEPPWTFRVFGERVELDVTGEKMEFPVLGF